MLAERDFERRRAADWRAGVLASLFHNAHRAKGAKASEPPDFFPSLKDRPTAALPASQSPEQMLSIFQIITGAKVIQ